MRMPRSRSARNLGKEFADPSDIYRPQPFWHINGTLTTEGIRKQLSDAIQETDSAAWPSFR